MHVVRCPVDNAQIGLCVDFRWWGNAQKSGLCRGFLSWYLYHKLYVICSICHALCHLLYMSCSMSSALYVILYVMRSMLYAWPGTTFEIWGGGGGGGGGGGVTYNRPCMSMDNGHRFLMLHNPLNGFLPVVETTFCRHAIHITSQWHFALHSMHVYNNSKEQRPHCQVM